MYNLFLFFKLIIELYPSHAVKVRLKTYFKFEYF